MPIFVSPGQTIVWEVYLTGPHTVIQPRLSQTYYHIMAGAEALLTSKCHSSIIDIRLLQFVDSKERECCLQQGSLTVEQSASEVELKEMVEVGLVDLDRQAGQSQGISSFSS